MTTDDVIGSYWNYYLSLEYQVAEIERYIEFDLSINGNVYSARLLELLQSICSEIDVIGKELAYLCDSGFYASKYTSIEKWWFTIQNSFQNIQSETVYFRKEIILPWKDFLVRKDKDKFKVDLTVPNAQIPIWWNSYNNVKHRRTERDDNGLLLYTQANLKNVIHALSGLLILETLLLEKNGCVVDRNRLFKFDGHHVFRNYMSWGAT